MLFILKSAVIFLNEFFRTPIPQQGEINMTKIALVTGATAGFGNAICRTLLKAGYLVIGTGRRQERLAQLEQEYGSQFFPLAFDISDRQATENAFKTLPTELQAIDLLVNNAGLALGLESADKADLDDWEKMIDGGTKAFVKQFSLNLRADLAGTNVRVSNIEPGLCGGTEFSNVRFKGDDARAAQVYENVQYVTPQDIANIVLWLNQQPEHVNINRIEVMPTAQTFNPLKVSKND